MSGSPLHCPSLPISLFSLEEESEKVLPEVLPKDLLQEMRKELEEDEEWEWNIKVNVTPS